MNSYRSIFSSGRVASLYLALALCGASIVPAALADDGNCGNGVGTGNGCLPQGAVGPQGPKGDTGAQGSAGPVGPQGLKGDAGPQGPAGPTGAQGPKGETGAVGPQGVAGPQGLQGETGAVGPQGPAGPQGQKGETGATGPQGLGGVQGLKGETGLQGPAGPAGAAGPQGQQGLTGPMGLRGLQGEKGDKGEQGERGLPGGFTSVMEVQRGPERAIDARQGIPGGSLTAAVPVVQQNVTAGDFVLNANVDLAPTLPMAQQYTCQLKMANQVEPVDSLPIIYGAQTRLHLSGAVHLSTPGQVTLSCGSDAPATLLKARLIVLRVDHSNPGMLSSN